MWAPLVTVQISNDILPRSTLLKHSWCYRVSYAGFQVLKDVDLNLVDNVLYITPQKNSIGLNPAT
jgi:hypothetical protein